VASVRVWDPLVRVLHWALVAAVATSWLTHAGGGAWHEWLGYTALAVVALRVRWGFRGPRRARFAQFVRGPRATLRYAAAVAARREPRHLGHNPLGAWMIVLLLAMTALVCASGWLYTTDAYWGEQWLEELHGALSDALLALIALHLAGVAFTSIRHRENLAAAMLHGNKREAAPGDEA
jgi:cytochrome b